ncbi:MAG: glycoside hydrolase family 38 C-terminal domain-containing protein [Candidatus Aminicenantales bacterium]
MPRPKIHLVSNAHLDPVWLWDWEEGAGEALSTFRSAAALCQEFPDFVFNHNEAILYHWVEEYEPALFKRIQRLVKEKRWHILGGWYLQPDCNMPCGESLVRQILLGKRYFRRKFGVDVRTASNLDPFGHSRGLVQILAKAGYDSYIFCRPGRSDGSLPAEDFVWVGFDGSEVMASLVSAHYNSAGGEAKKKVLDWIATNPGRELSLLLWGVGDHGGGAYRIDLRELGDLMKEQRSYEIRHSHPEAYFQDLKNKRSALPRHAKDINPWAVGCYTTMARIKQKHRLLENDLFLAEKMAAAASYQGLMTYPREELHNAQIDLAFSQFHDILPGSAIQPAEESSVRRLDHGLEILSRIKARAFFAMASGEMPTPEGEIPLLAYNPHPFRVMGIFACEFQPYEINRSGRYLFPRVYSGRKPLPSQPEKEDSNLNIEWRKKVVFAAELEPSRMNRFVCRLEKRPGKPAPQIKREGRKIVFRTHEIEVVINAGTGLVDVYRVRGRDFLAANAFTPLVMSDNADPWGMTVKRFRDRAGRFELAAAGEGSEASGISAQPAPSVRIVEDGAVRTVVESVLTYGRSVIFQRYKLPRQGTEIEVELRVHWNEKDRMLKSAVPTLFPQARYIGQTAYGVAELPADGNEAVAQKWLAVVSDKDDAALTVINDCIYGSDFLEGELRLSLLRSAAYSADPVPSGPMVAQDRYVPRIDQGERMFRIWINGGKRSSRMTAVDREALVKNEKPPLLAFFSAGRGKKSQPFVLLSDQAVEITALKKTEDGNDLIIRLFEPTGKSRTTTLSLPWAGAKKAVRLQAFEIKTLAFNRKTGRFRELDLLERPLSGSR